MVVWQHSPCTVHSFNVTLQFYASRATLYLICHWFHVIQWNWLLLWACHSMSWTASFSCYMYYICISACLDIWSWIHYLVSLLNVYFCCLLAMIKDFGAFPVHWALNSYSGAVLVSILLMNYDCFLLWRSTGSWRMGGVGLLLFIHLSFHRYMH